MFNVQGMISWIYIGCEVHLLHLLDFCIRFLEVVSVVLVASSGGGTIILTLVEMVVKTI